MNVFESLLPAARARGWRIAVEEHLGSAEAYAWSADDYRAVAPLLALPALGSVCLDTACGQGTYAFALARVCHTVLVADPDPDAVRFTSLRAHQDNTPEITGLIGNPPECIRPESLDMLLTNGLPETGRLQTLATLLKPGGAICLSISNPRSSLNRTHKEPGSGYAEIKKALADAGLDLTHMFAALPHPQDTRMLVNTQDPRGLICLLKERYPRLPLPGLAIRWINRVFRTRITPGYWAIARRPPVETGVLEQTLRHGLQAHLAGGQKLCLPQIHANRGTFTALVFADQQKKPLAVFRMDAARSLVSHESQVLSTLGRHADPELCRSIPQILWQGSFGGRSAALQSVLRGARSTASRTPRGLARNLARLSDWLLRLHQVPPDESAPIPEALAWLGDLYRDEAELRLHLGPELGPRIHAALGELQAAGLRKGWVHGDLHPGNLLISSHGLLVLDWEYATCSWPVFDWFHYIGAVLLDRKHAGSTTPEQACGTLQETLANRSWSETIGNATARFLEGLGLKHRHVPAAAQVGIFDFLRRRFGLQAMDSFQPLLRKEFLSGIFLT